MPILLQAESELPLNHKRLSEKVLVVWIGDYMQSIATVALATEKGIVVIEASLIRKNDARIRRVIEKEFGRNDFKYLINTHYHHDHTAGNQVYSDATIIAHKNLPAGMKKELTGEGLVSLVDKFKGRLKGIEEALEHMEPQSRDYKTAKERITCLKIVAEELTSGFIPTYPSTLFEKNLTIDMGDMTLELYSFGGMHTDSDIVIFIPEEGIVAVGDMPPDQWLPYIRKELTSDFSITLEHWGRIVESKWGIKHLNMAHSDMNLSVETFKEQYKYLNTLWQGLSEMYRQGVKIEDAKKKFTIEEDFPYFKNRIVQTSRGNIHEYNIEAIWERISKK
jgi:glyoxylase-like metal-dependent hydrolase (beta-lactamase superfamily II)